MDSVALTNESAERAFVAKEARRKTLARLPYSEKVLAVIKMQEMTAPILRRRGIRANVWKIKPPES